MRTWMIFLLAALLGAFSLIAISCGDDDDDDDDNDSDADDDDDDGGFALTSSAFGAGEDIPVEYSCDNPDYADGVSPPLAWSNPPEDAMFFALTMFDPDAGDTPHWGVFDIPADTTELADGLMPDGTLPGNAWEAISYISAPQYAGPCPPPGETHDYVFTIYALDAGMPDFDTTPDLADMLDHIADREIDSATLTAQFGH